MELVKGLPITRFCDENRLTPRERLELFVPVCQAVQHAHQKGVIHRDLKPSNVLVTLYDGQPVPKAIDFGVAKALHQKLTERTMFTAFGTVIGTLEYMSPEQAEMNALLAEAGWHPGQRVIADKERNNCLLRLCALAPHGSHAEATTAAGALAAHWPKDPNFLYNCACVHALAAGAVKNDAALAERYAARAVALLQQAVKAGYNNGEQIGKDTDLDALRRRMDFLQLQKELADKR